MQRNLKFSQTSHFLKGKLDLTCLRLAQYQQLHQIEHYKYESAPEPPQPEKKRNVDDNNLAAHGDLYFQSDKIIYHLPDSAEGMARCNLNMWVGIEI